MKTTPCRGCGAPLLWLKTAGGKDMPCDSRRISIITDDGKVVTGYEPHWGNCPERERFKKKGGNNGQ